MNEDARLEDARLIKWLNKYYLSGVRRDTTPNGVGRMELSEIEIDEDTAIWEKNGEKFKSEIVDVSVARRLPSIQEKRPVIEMTVHFNNKSYPNTRIGLTTTDTASEMLVNRELMTTFKIAVIANRRFILSDHVGKEDDTDT